jgi:hypothetical protein
VAGHQEPDQAAVHPAAQGHLLTLRGSQGG